MPWRGSGIAHNQAGSGAGGLGISPEQRLEARYVLRNSRTGGLWSYILPCGVALEFLDICFPIFEIPSMGLGEEGSITPHPYQKFSSNQDGDDTFGIRQNAREGASYADACEGWGEDFPEPGD